MKLATDEELKGETYRVFFVIMANMDKEYFSAVVPVSIAKILSITRQSASRAVSKLAEQGIIERRYFSDKLVGFNVLVFGKETLPPE